MHLDPYMPYVTALAFAVVAAGLVLKRLRQPVVLAYLALGIACGPHGFGLIESPEVLEHLGASGVVLLLFFAGMEMSPAQIRAGWKVAALGTAFQILASVGCVALVGLALDWPTSRIVLLGFVISLSSTALVLRLLEERGESHSAVGRDVILILLSQDMAIVPMIILLGLLGGDPPPASTIAAQVIGGGALMVTVGWVIRKGEIHLPFGILVAKDKELQVFTALALCFGLALVTGLLELSSALGAFVAGLIVNAARETDWVQNALKPFEVLLVAIFLLSVGMQIDPSFLWTHAGSLALLVAAVFATNTVVNGLALRALGRPWHESWHAGALLSQVGEFSFVLALIGFQAGIINEFAYQTTLGLISLSLVASPAWISLLRHRTHRAMS